MHNFSFSYFSSEIYSFDHQYNECTGILQCTASSRVREKIIVILHSLKTSLNLFFIDEYEIVGSTI